MIKLNNENLANYVEFKRDKLDNNFTEEELQQYLNFQEKFYAAILEEGKTLKKEKEN